MKISVILAMYNGEKYIIDQLDSILNQTRLPDEVLISDDKSTDKSVETVRGFIKQNGLDNWKLIENNKNVGWRSNFSNLIEQSSGEIVFLSDQDDIWDHDKLRLMEQAFQVSPQAEVIVSDYVPLASDSDRKVEFGIIDEKNINDDVYQVSDDFNNFFIKRPGWTFAIRSTIIPDFISLWGKAPGKGHDTLLWQLALSRKRLFHLRSVTGKWRMHNGSAIAIESKKKLSFHKLVSYLHDESNSVDVYLSFAEGKIEEQMRSYQKSIDSRLRVLDKTTVWSILSNACNYDKKSTLLADIVRGWRN